MEGIQTALTDAFTTVATNCNTAIANVLYWPGHDLNGVVSHQNEWHAGAG